MDCHEERGGDSKRDAGEECSVTAAPSCLQPSPLSELIVEATTAMTVEKADRVANRHRTIVLLLNLKSSFGVVDVEVDIEAKIRLLRAVVATAIATGTSSPT
ncbi:hypothetical protein PIB30_013020 [Stylosanthes scabra]|uniref:Uncharacterized protein n=1 Tax=Stylosanthes scabra TaxID=79078 RepID=A0ABU6R6V8_9FABA|nr:hypothetical protein [Stylosanthes scabra]